MIIAEEIDLTGRFFGTVAKMMNDNGFESYYPGLNPGPRALGSHRLRLQWLNQRLYVRDDLERILGVNLSMKNDAGRNQIPFLTCGLIHVTTEMRGKSYELCEAGWNDDGGRY